MTSTVLLVEDEIFVALDVQFIMEDAGWRVDGPYATVADALEALSARLPDCAVLDVRLLDGEVFAAADRLRAAGVPLIFHSGHADESDLAGRYPGSSVCAKPCSAAHLRQQVALALGG